jgi:hypothetical protein
VQSPAIVFSNNADLFKGEFLMKEPLEIKLPSISIAELSRAFLSVGVAVNALTKALSQGTLFEDMQRHIENEQWRNDPLELKKRFLDPVPAFIAGRLRAIADKLDK